MENTPDVIAGGNHYLRYPTLRVKRSVSFQALLDSFHVERPASFQALLCSSARAESNTSSLVLRYYARRLAFFFS